MSIDSMRPTVLAIDTSGPVAGCAVLKDGKIVHLTAMNHGLTHSETIMPAVDAALEGAGLRCGDVDVFAAVAGPGSFTGVRIGVCAAKGLAHAVGKPCAAVHALEALAMNFYGFDGLCCPILDARRGQVYCAAFDMARGWPERALADAALPLEDFLATLPRGRRLAFVGDGVPAYGAAVRENPGRPGPDRPRPPAGPARRRGMPAGRRKAGNLDPRRPTAAHLPQSPPGGTGEGARGGVGDEE